MIDRTTSGDQEIEKQYTTLKPIGRMGKPEEIVNAVVWLCSNEVSFVSGIAMPVDGGFVA